MTEYLVALDVFAGPLDVLLRLIEHEELDITRVSLALVADQFLAYVADIKSVSATNLADFLVIAARLLVLKSRVLLPQPQQEEEDEEEEDWEGDLVARLREYKRFKQVAEALREIEQSGLRAYPRVAPPPKIEPRLKPGEASLAELVEAFRQALKAHPVASPVDGVVAAVVVHIGDCVRNILDRVQRYPRVRFSTLMRHARSRLEIIVTFLAMLELIKQQRIKATQDSAFGEVFLEQRTPDPDADPAPIDLREYGESEEPAVTTAEG